MWYNMLIKIININIIMSLKIKGKVYNILAEQIWLGIIIVCLAFFSLWLPTLYGGVENAKAASTYTVCAEGCDYFKLFGDAGALAATTPGDTIEIWPGYSSTTEEWYDSGGGNWYNGMPTSSLTIICSSTDVVFEGITSTDSYEINTGGNVPGPSYQNCTFNNISLEVASSSVVSGNIFNRTDNVIVIKDVIVAGSNPSDITITNNTFNDDWGDSTSSQVMIQFDQLTGVHSNIVISSNTFNYEADGVSAGGGVIAIPGGDFTIQGNYFKLGSNLSGENSIGIIAQPSTLSGPLNLTLSHNTFWFQSQATFFDALNINSGDPATGFGNVIATSTYNLFFSENVTSEADGVVGMNISWNTSTYSASIYEDYNGYYGLDTNINIAGTVIPSATVTEVGNSVTTDPYLKKGDVDTTNDMQLAPFSSYLDINGTEDIGAYSAVRETSFTIDDDGTIDYSTVHATSTAIITQSARTDDTFNLSTGTYSAFSISSSTKLTGNLTIDGAGAGTIINASTNETGITLTGINTSTISDLVVQNASSTFNSYTITNVLFTEGVTNYIDTVEIGSPPESTMILNNAGCTGADFAFINMDGADVTSLVSGENDWHLALGSSGGGADLTILVPNQIIANQAAFDSACNPTVGWTTDFWVPSVFSNTGGVFTYDADTLSGLGISIYDGKTDPAELSDELVAYAGIKLDNAINNLFSNVTTTDNYYGLWLKTGSANNIVSSSVFSSNTGYDIYNKALGNNSIKNTSFLTASTSITGVGNINVYEKARAYVTNSSTVALSGVGVTFTSADLSVTETVTTTAAGYTPYTDHLLSWVMSSSSVAVTNGGYNPFTVSATATSTYYATSTSSNLNSVNQTFSLVMLNAGTTQSTTTLAVTEGSTTSSYTIVLDSLPTNNVVITLAISTADISLSTTTLTFTTANWNTAQTVTVTAVDDSLDEDDEDVVITHTAVSDDSNYNGISISNVTTTVTDNDTAGVTISDTTMSVTEGGDTDTYTIVLDSQPTTTVSIALSATGSKVTLATSPVVFTTSNWDTPQTVTVTAVDDSTVEGTHSDTVTAIATSDDTDYDAISISDVTATITDNDVAASPSGSGGGISNITYPSKMNPEAKDFAINNDAIKTNSTQVTLNFNFKNVDKIAVSNSDSFEKASFEDYQASKQWTLESGNGTKYVYAKIRSLSGGTITVSDNIELDAPAQEQTTPVTDVEIDTCTLTEKQSYKHPASPAVYYITSDCTKRAFKRSDVFFTYFDSWDDVGLTTKTKLDSITDDTLGFMPWGPKYDPKYGALVKIVTDPKVYLLLGTEKYWITSEAVFTALKYSWNWIEDIATDLLDKYTVGSEITYTDHHPNYTLIKYEDDSKVYRLEPNPTDSGQQIKRWILDEETFNSLNFRWDRIVIVDDSEVYSDGEELSL